MSYIYTYDKGLIPTRNNTKKYITAAVVAIAMALAYAIPTFAAQPTSPGCFGRDRAAYANENGSLGNEPGGVGYHASLRASANGEINRAYKTDCGGDPTQL